MCVHITEHPGPVIVMCKCYTYGSTLYGGSVAGIVSTSDRCVCVSGNVETVKTAVVLVRKNFR